jgi:hypothetical protein
MAEKVEYTEYQKAMVIFAKKFQDALKASLAKPYPFAPGYNKERSSFGVRNMTSKSGDLYKSIKVKFNANDDTIVISMLDYWQNVNDGRKPGKYVPIKPLMQWIRRKGFNKNKKTGKFQKFNIKGMAFAVSKNIQKFGIAPTNFYDDAFAGFIEDYTNGPLPALGLDVQNFFAKIIDPTAKTTNK